jgi:Tol biopolymer transport system component
VRRWVVLLLGAGAVLTLSAASPASNRAFRGRNGLIVFASRMDFTYDQVVHNVGSWEIYTTDAAGRRVTRLTHNRVEDQAPRWSPDARRIVFVRSCCGSKARVRHIYVMNANGTGEHTISGRHNDYLPAWSPNGKRIAFAAGPRAALSVISPDGSNRREVRTAKNNTITGVTYAPVWSSDSREIDFEGGDPDVWENPPSGVWAVNVETGAVRRLFREDLLRIEWSPDGKRMLMFDHRGLEVAHADGTHRRQLKRADESIFGCTWSPDSRRLACIEHFPHEEDVELTAMNVDATGMTRLTTNNADEEPWLDWGRARG